MKSNKNRNNPGIASKNTPKIQTYFQSVPKSFIFEDDSLESNRDSDDAIKASYIDDLKKKLLDIHEENGDRGENKSSQQSDGACSLVQKNSEIKLKKTQINSHGDNLKKSTECAGCIEKTNELIEKEKECQEWQRKYKELKKVYLRATVSLTEVNSKFSDLLKVAANTQHQAIGGTELSSDDIFTKNEIRVLQGMSFDEQKDATFIRESLQYAYKADLTVFASRTLTGKRPWVEMVEDGEEKHHAAKDPLTPEKVNRIRELFIDRISKCDISSADYSKRMREAYINKMFAAGIQNIAKKHK